MWKCQFPMNSSFCCHVPLFAWGGCRQSSVCSSTHGASSYMQRFIPTTSALAPWQSVGCCQNSKNAAPQPVHCHLGALNINRHLVDSPEVGQEWGREKLCNATLCVKKGHSLKQSARDWQWSFWPWLSEQTRDENRKHPIQTTKFTLNCFVVCFSYLYTSFSYLSSPLPGVWASWPHPCA